MDSEARGTAHCVVWVLQQVGQFDGDGGSFPFAMLHDLETDLNIFGVFVAQEGN